MLPSTPALPHVGKLVTRAAAISRQLLSAFTAQDLHGDQLNPKDRNAHRYRHPVSQSAAPERVSGASDPRIGYSKYLLIASPPRAGEGRHTTTASVLHTLPEGGRLVDTPGVRDFVPAVRERHPISRGFIAIEAAGRECRFTACLHLRETHCAVQEALSEGRIEPRRFESYRRLLNLQRQALR
ncbi:MAG: GTPase RsgA [Gammaproteobacteria bacterium]|nr:GTPase RsgA [Gammaproteobacteria bacterium]